MNWADAVQWGVIGFLFWKGAWNESRIDRLEERK